MAVTVIGVVVFSFALRLSEQEPNPCNIRLAKAAEQIIRDIRVAGDEPILISQWEGVKQLEADGYVPVHVVQLRADGSYLDSKAVWEEARQVLWEQYDVVNIVVVAQPFLQLRSVQKMIKQADFTVIKSKIPWIGFDNTWINTQPWTKSALALLMYAVKLKLGIGMHGHAGQQDAR